MSDSGRFVLRVYKLKYSGIGIISEPTNMTPAIAAGITAAVVGTKVGKEKYNSRNVLFCNNK